MAWRLGIMVAIWVLLLGGSPAAAAIQRSVDRQGVIHIRNAATAKPAKRPALSQEELPAAAPAPVIAAPAPGEPQATAPAPVIDASLARPEDQHQPVRREADHPDTIQINNNPPAVVQEGSKADSGAQTTLRKVSCSGAGPEKPAAPARPPLTPSPAAEDGVITKYRDHHGVLHITNVSPSTEKTGGPAVQVARGQEDDGPASLQKTKALGESPKKGSAETFAGLRKVAYSNGQGLTGVVGRLSARTPAAVAPGGIRRYRDAKGVLHIENGAPEGLEPADSRPLLARAGPGRGRDSPLGSGNILPISQEEVIARLAVKQTAWRKADRGPPAAPKIMASGKSLVLAGGTIRRYRDARGVWHIESVEPAWPRAGPTPVQLADQLPGAVGRVFAGGEPGGTAVGATSGSPTVTASGASRVVAYRDSRGRLKICNQEADPRIARAPPSGGGLDRLILEAAQANNLPPTLILALIKVESNFVPWAVSPKGAMGLMQLMPGTADFLGVRDPFSPWENIHGGCRYLRLLVDYFGGSLPLALAAYNAGFQRVVNCGFKIPPIKETQEFVTRVLGHYYTWEKGARAPWV